MAQVRRDAGLTRGAPILDFERWGQSALRAIWSAR